MTVDTHQSQHDQRVYELAREYLLSLDGVTLEMLDRHLTMSADERPTTLAAIYKHLLETAQNANMGPIVIGQAIGGVDKLADLLENFQPKDVHIKKIFTALKLCPSDNDYQVFKAILRVARNVGVPPYAVDHLFWLVGSGNFYRDGIQVGWHRVKFIVYATEKIEKI